MPSAKQPAARMQPDRIELIHRCPPARTALLVVDMQHGFLDPGASLEMAKGRPIIPNLRRLMAACRTGGVPVIFTRFVYSTAVPCLRGDPFGIEHLPAVPGQPTGFGWPSGNCLIGPDASRGAESADIVLNWRRCPANWSWRATSMTSSSIRRWTWRCAVVALPICSSPVSPPTISRTGEPKARVAVIMGTKGRGGVPQGC